MGFNISIGSDSDLEYGDCDTFIGRGYFIFAASYNLFGDESVIIASGKAAGLDLTPLATLWYEDMGPPDEESAEGYVYQDQAPPEYRFSPDEMLALLNGFRDYVANNPGFIDHVEFSSKENIDQQDEFREYFTSGESLKDLQETIKEIECHKHGGATWISFNVS